MKYLKNKLYIHVVSKKENGKAALNKQDSGFVQLNNIDLTSNLFLLFLNGEKRPLEVTPDIFPFESHIISN